MLTLVVLVTGCGSDDQDNAERHRAAAQATSAPTSAPDQRNALVGRWELRQTCEGMVTSLDQAGLRAIAAAIVGDFFADQSPKQLARKGDVCEGAEPHQHSHFFTPDGQFGSLDQNGEQVDGQPYASSTVGRFASTASSAPRITATASTQAIV
jgi:hypothetical protein